jgi:predicted nucleic acid-binding protein
VTVVVDTSVLIDHLRGRAAARQLLVEQARAGHRLAAR